MTLVQPPSAFAHQTTAGDSSQCVQRERRFKTSGAAFIHAAMALPPSLWGRSPRTAGSWPRAADLCAAASRQLSEVQRPSNHVVVTPARGPMRSIENRLTLTMARRGTQQCGSVNSPKPLCTKRHGHLVWMAGIAVSQHNLPTASCRHDRVSIDMETRSCLKKSSFPEPLRDIEQRHLLSSGSDISFISGRQAPDDRPCGNAPMIN
jgi:hypothetical protein